MSMSCEWRTSLSDAEMPDVKNTPNDDLMEQQLISEIKFEPEEVTETTYFEGQGYEEEVVTTVGCIEDAIGEMCELREKEDDDNDEHSGTQLSDALNDHNYTSQELVLSQPRLGSVKDLLLSQIVSSSDTVPTNVSNFVDNTINKIKILRLENSKREADESVLDFNCSEPLEVEPGDEYFESLYKNFSESAIGLSKRLADTLSCAKDILNHCNAETVQTEEELQVFISSKIKELQKVANIKQTTSTEATQTNTKSFFKKRHRINRNAKRNLLNSDSDSSRYDSDNASSSNEAFRSCSVETSTKQADKESVRCRNLEYNDGIDLSKYIKLDITNKKFRQASCDMKGEGEATCSSADDTDKEIERLTNLSGLKKRHVQQRQVKLKDKPKTKPLSVRGIEALDESEDDMEALDSDHSCKETDDEAITENQYLSRFNEQIKKELLDDSNSDSGLSDESDYNQLKDSSSSENESKSEVVDKFLQVFKCDDDGGNTEDIEVKLDLDGVLKESDSHDEQSWHDNIVKPKRSKKSLEKRLAEAEKRNQNEEIVVSSESEYSEAEPEPVEVNTRVLKPMLRMDQLAKETRAAQETETERVRRLEQKQKTMTKALKNNKNTQANAFILDYLEKTKTFVQVDEDLVKLLKPHQIDGIKFMYDSCYGGIDHSKKNTGSGCILAHCMGLGKTLQLIALLHTVISYKELNTSKVLVLCPKSTVMNWADELQRWLGPLKSKTKYKVYVFPDLSDISDKLRVLEEWSLSSASKAGCLLVGYEAFRTLVFYKNRGNLSTSKLESIRDKVNKYLLEPGADLVVCDEGHIIKNSKSAISLAVSKIITPKRIMLTGTPIQNNLKEYYSMVNFIKPLYLGTEKEFANLYANPIKNGQHKDSSKKDITVMKQRSFVLHKKLSNFVQRKEAELLKTFLPQKFEYVLFIPMTAVQNTLYEYILEAIASRGDSRGKSLITDYTVLRKIWTHPKVLEDAWKNANMQKNKKETKRAGVPHSDDDQPDDIYDSQTGTISVTNDWWRKDLSKKDLETIMPSNKLRTMFTILRMCEEKGEKCLIFSAFVAVLNVVEYFFKKITESDPEILQHTHIPTTFKSSNSWINGQDYYRLDGKTPKNIRHEMIKRFNSEANRRARVFLISAKAGGQGINLIGANRVIILDTSWNPSNDQQNIFRIFRLGQKKNCYIYRLIAMGTMEEKVYTRSVTKQAMSFRVVDEQQIDRHYNMAELAELYTLTKPVQSERTMPVLPKDTILAHLLRQSELVYKYHEHDSLLENKVEQELSEQEKADAWHTYERELQMNLAQQEGLTADKMPNAMPASKLNPYPGLDMQTLLNYSLQSASLIPQYGYNLNQNYLDTLSMYQKYSALRFNDMNTDLSSYASPFGVLPNANRMQPSAQLMSTMQNLANASKPHSRDLGLPRTGQPLAHPTMHHPLTTESPSLASLSANASANNVLSTLGQYKQFLDNPLSSLLNYSTSYSALAQGGGLHPNPNEILEAVDSLNKRDKTTKSRTSMDQNKTLTAPDIRATIAPIVSSVDLTTTTPVNVPVKNPVTMKKHPGPPTTSVDLTTTTTFADTLAKKTTQQSDIDKTVKSTKPTNVNFPLGFPSDAASALPKDFLKNNAAMQIIPTTSPPGTSSITKQLNEISPSISLTAVNPPTEIAKSRPQDVQKSPNITAPNILKSKKAPNPNVFSLSKTVRDKNLPANFMPTKKAPDNYNLMSGDLGKVSVSSVKPVSSVTQKTATPNSPNIIRPVATNQLLSSSPTTNATQQFRQQPLANEASKNSGNKPIKDVNFQSDSRKRLSDNMKSNVNSKRTKLPNDNNPFV
ncbi:transcriptional regulator ATRX homolog [Drosophila nasuta]|uniref:transcriptional regulator ATRX homolog n=1 Tax=Drosophila nasuta TaxID=42062 RepID=UPI00295EC8DD|nr:transcriptional regulator ATRX homolog [Drosophila nasuta]